LADVDHGYRAELRRIERELADVSAADPFAVPVDPERLTRYVSLLYRRASIAGDLAQLSAVERAIERAVLLLRNPGDFYLLKANVAFKLHRLADAEAALSGIATAGCCSEARLLRADLDFQYGRYRETEAAYAAAIEAGGSWSGLARLAYFRGKMGNLEDADRLYREAEDDLTAKEMRSFAWLEVQRGFLAFSSGAYAEARSHYDRAETAYPGYWLVGEYQAELLGAEGKYSESIERFQALAAGSGRPDLLQAIGELYEVAGQADAARHWQERALAGYMQSVRRGEVHYYHHLADYYADVAKDGAAAIVWSRADLQLRENFATQAALAWAYYRNGEFDSARGWIDRALASGIVDARLLFRAAEIYAAENDGDRAGQLLEGARTLNPFVDGFHVHH
jgi:tetratricopeptide (TPR) repeat protein